MAEIRALLFDMDGVLVDSNPLHRIAWEEYCRRFGVDPTEQMQQGMYGKRNDAIVRDFLGTHLTDDEVFRHGAAKEALYREMLTGRIEETIVPGLRAFLDRHRDLPAAIATNAEPANVNFLLDKGDLRQYFRATIDGHQVRNPKPHPDIYLRAAEVLGVLPAACVVFEDSYTGVDAGLAAGMRVVGLSTTHDDLAGVSLLIPDFLDPVLEKWLSAQH